MSIEKKMSTCMHIITQQSVNFYTIPGEDVKQNAEKYTS